MANVSTVSTPLGASAKGAGSARKPGIFRTILAAIMESRRRRAEIEVAEFLARHRGSKLR
jgi:hypothetical protein